jgi:hypothetical protein
MISSLQLQNVHRGAQPARRSLSAASHDRPGSTVSPRPCGLLGLGLSTPLPHPAPATPRSVSGERQVDRWPRRADRELLPVACVAQTAYPRRDGRDFLVLAARHRLLGEHDDALPGGRADAVLDGDGVDLSRSITGVKRRSRRRPSARYLSDHHRGNGIVRQRRVLTGRACIALWSLSPDLDIAKISDPLETEAEP